MVTNCLKCKKKKEKKTKKKTTTKNKDAKMIKTRNGRLALSSKCVVRGNKKSSFVKEQEAKGLISNQGLKTPLSKIPILSEVLF